MQLTDEEWARFERRAWWPKKRESRRLFPRQVVWRYGNTWELALADRLVNGAKMADLIEMVEHRLAKEQANYPLTNRDRWGEIYPDYEGSHAIMRRMSEYMKVLAAMKDGTWTWYPTHTIAAAGKTWDLDTVEPWVMPDCPDNNNDGDK